MTQSTSVQNQSTSEFNTGTVISLHPDGRLDVRLDGDAAVIACRPMRQPGAMTPAYQIADLVVVLRSNPQSDHGVVIGLLDQPAQPVTESPQLPDEIVLAANQQIVLRVGQSRIVVRSDRILIDGKEVATVAKGTNTIRGGDVAVN